MCDTNCATRSSYLWQIFNMTTFEHAMLGINGVLAAGLHRRFGWQLVALAGFAAVAPDWDGIPMLMNMARFESGHRVWGHNVFACCALGVLIGSLDYRFDWTSRLAKRLTRWGPLKEYDHRVHPRSDRSSLGWMVWMTVATIAALSQIPADAVVSGWRGLSDWALKPFWPISDWKFVYSLVPWGNIGVTVIFAVGMIAQVKIQSKVQQIAQVVLAAVVVYIVAWGAWMG
jgi:LexA-binding, inner membrane-associated putative hydrolase